MFGSDVRVEPTPDGRRLVVSRVVDAPPAAAWDLFVDTASWPDWGPSVRAVEVTGSPDPENPDRIGPGTTGRVRVVGGAWVPFHIEAFDAEERRWTWRVAGVPATGHRVESTADGRARVGFEIPLLAAGYAPVCARALVRIESLLRSSK